MSVMKPILAILCAAAPAAFAAWTFETLTASAGVMSSRIVNGVERTNIAYRNSSLDLMAATTTGGPLSIETVLANANPGNPHVSTGTNSTGTALISYWTANAFRFALRVTPGAGNCGPSSNWRCGSVPLPSQAGGAQSERMVGQVDANGVAHFVYRLRGAANSTSDGLYYTSRSTAGLFSAPLLLATPSFSLVSVSPRAIQLVSGSDWTILGLQTAQDNQGLLIRRTAAGLTAESLPGGPVAPGLPLLNEADMAKSSPPLSVCAVRPANPNLNPPAGSAQILMYSRSSATSQWVTSPVTINQFPTFEFASQHCSHLVRTTGQFVTTYTSGGAIRLARREAGLSNPTWETVDSSGTFLRPFLGTQANGKLTLLYQSPGILKFAREQ